MNGYYNLPEGVIFLVSLKAMIVKDGKLMLLQGTGQDYDGFWELPGGLIEIDEEPAACLKREVLEETGMTIKAGRPLKVYPTEYEKFTVRNGKTYKVRLIVIAFACTLVSGEYKLSPEHSGVNFFSPGEINDLKINPLNQPAIAEFLKNP
jgi:8-oxo-dGTP pyrophosphatase MutT (NUDIX family)